MIIDQLYTKCLAQGAYYIEHNGEAAVIDPLREVNGYVNRAKANGAKIKYIFETHFHADFVSGHVSLSETTGAPIVYGPKADPSFEAYIAEDGEEFNIGELTLKVLHTPGHTMESSTYLLINPKGKNIAIFTGDTLFLGDVGRPDLAQKGGDITQEELAGILFDSLRNKILPLADDVIVYPAHGAGSACGKNMMKETVDTLGNQKKVNYALREDMTKEEFVVEVCDGLMAPPAYFPQNVMLNKHGYTSVEKLIDKGSKELSVDEFVRLSNDKETIVLDVRHQKDFIVSHIPGSIFIGLNGGFAPWVGAVLRDVNQKLVLVTPGGKEKEAITRLARVGFDQVLGYLEGGIENWINHKKEIDTLESITANQFHGRISEAEKIEIIDVRKPGEFAAGHINGAKHFPLSTIDDSCNDLPKGETLHIHCAGGYRSVIASSILKRKGIHDIIDIAGGMGAIKKTSIELVETECALS